MAALSNVSHHPLISASVCAAPVTGRRQPHGGDAPRLECTPAAQMLESAPVVRRLECAPAVRRLVRCVVGQM